LIKSLRQKWRKTTLGRSVRVFSRSDQRKILAVMVLQVSMGILDLMGVAIIGVLGALAVSGVQSENPGNRVTSVLELLHLANQPFQTQAAILGTLATALLITRTIFSILFTRRTLFFLSRRGARISTVLISRLLSQPLLQVQAKSPQQTTFAVTTGVSTITLGVVGTTVGLVSDGSLLLVMTIGLFVVDPFMAFGTFFVFAAIGFALYRLLHKKARDLGMRESALTIKSNQKIYEVLSSYRESVVRNRRSYYANEIGKIRLELADTLAELSFMPYIGKYVIETTVILGALFISAVQFILQDAGHAVATLSVFLAAGTRIAPAVLRIQQGTLAIKSSLGAAGPTLELIESLGDSETNESIDDVLQTEHSGFSADVKIENISLTYPGKTEPALSELSLIIPNGTSVALVGASGAGKTSLVDVLLGVLTPSHGKITVSGNSPLVAISKWSGAISYVPQDVIISNGTIRENVAMGYPAECVSDELVWQALEVAQLDDFVRTLPQGLHTHVGDRGTKISGGQRQRLGIARAMLTKPKLLVLDEATSSLDGQTEADISRALLHLKGEVTLVMIAHRLSSVRNVDRVVYMDKGKITAMGSFDEVRKSIADFDRQASLMGL